MFFSLSLGFGLILTHASYLKLDADVALRVLTAVSGNEFCEALLGGMPDPSGTITGRCR